MTVVESKRQERMQQQAESARKRQRSPEEQEILTALKTFGPLTPDEMQKRLGVEWSVTFDDATWARRCGLDRAEKRLRWWGLIEKLPGTNKIGLPGHLLAALRAEMASALEHATAVRKRIRALERMGVK